MTSDMIMGAIMGALVVCAALSLAHKVRLIHIGLGPEREVAAASVSVGAAPAAVRKLYPRIGCNITCEAKGDHNSAGLTPQVRLFATIENEGEVVLRSLKGYWKVVTPDKFKHPTIKILRDVLPVADRYLESYLLDEGVDMQGEGARFDVDVEFDYGVQSDDEVRHYSAKFRYDRKRHRMVKL